MIYTVEDLSYAAGIMDGEGTIHIARNPSKGYVNYTLRVAVVMTDTIVPIWLHNTFGGGLLSYPPKDSRHKAINHWYIVGSTALEFLSAILPYVKLKKSQIGLAIAFQELKHNRSGVRTPESITEAQLIIRKRMMELNNSRELKEKGIS